MDKTLKEQVSKFIEEHRQINNTHMEGNASFGNDPNMVLFVQGKEAVLKGLEELLQESS